MFDIGFGELVVVAVVALIVFGPEEFPVMIRNVMESISKVRRFISSVKVDLESELQRAEEIKRLVAKELEIAKQHASIDPGALTIPNQIRSAGQSPVESVTSAPVSEPVVPAAASLSSETSAEISGTVAPVGATSLNPPARPDHGAN